VQPAAEQAWLRSKGNPNPSRHFPAGIQCNLAARSASHNERGRRDIDLPGRSKPFQGAHPMPPASPIPPAAGIFQALVRRECRATVSAERAVSWKAPGRVLRRHRYRSRDETWRSFSFTAPNGVFR